MKATKGAAGRIACIGECMLEMTLPTPDHPDGRVGFAGDTFNTAVYVKRSARRVDVSYVTAIGTDPVSDRMLRMFDTELLDTALVERRPDRLPGAYAITLAPDGERSFTYWRSASAARTLFAEPAVVTPDRLAAFDIIYLSGITLAIISDQARADLARFLAKFRSGGGRVAFDSNYRPQLWSDPATARRETAAFWSLTDIGLPSLDDEMNLFGDTSSKDVQSRLRKAGVRRGALKRGIAGPVPIAHMDAQPEFLPADRVVDTTAAGDSFNGAYLGALMQGADAAACLQAGHDMARRVIGIRGAIIP